MIDDKIQKFFDAKLPGEIEAVKSLGEKIGYGHLMELASALWREKLKQTNTPTDGAFVTTIIHSIKKSDVKMTINTCKTYDSIIEKYNK